MRLVKVAAAVVNQTPLDWDANKAHLLSAIAEARRQSVSVLCLPELCLTGYGCEDAFHSAGTLRMAQQLLQEVVAETRGMIVGLGLPWLHGGALFNTACLAADGRIVGFVGKQNLAGDGIHYEPRWFKPWPEGVRASTELAGVRYPLGDLTFDCGGLRIGFEICEDAWVGDRPGLDQAIRGVDIILNPSASHFAFGKHEIRKRFVIEGSRAFFVSYVYGNLLGNEAGRAVYDGDAMIASNGKMLALGPRFSYADWDITAAVIDVEATRMSRARSSSFQVNVTELDDGCVRDCFCVAEAKYEAPRFQQADWELGEHLKEEEFARAVSLALFDYLRKSRSRGFVVSLSGGADSAAVSALVALLVHLGVSELGQSAFCKKLWHMPELSEAGDTQSLVAALLTCAYQATRNSSQATRDAASQVAQALGATYYHLDVDAIVQQYQQVVSNAIGRELNWEQDDIALQNIQARVRAPSIWMIANLTGGLLLATSNRSEAAVGYTTMDGDTCGGISPIAGIDKAFLRQWLNWMESSGPVELGPIPALAAVNCQQPTAELRPADQSQTDEGDLMPYDVLDTIERAAIRDKLTPLEIFRRLTPDSDIDPQQWLIWIERFFQLWSGNQWKRERFAPSFHLDDENLDPKTWCRFPILSGGFRRELQELRKYVAP